MKRWYVLGPLAGVVTGAAAFGIGVQGWRPVLIALVVTGVVMWARRYWPEGAYFPWPMVGNRVYGGGSHQVARLASTIAHRTRSRSPDLGLQFRLRRLAMVKLHRLGVPWDAPAAAELLGEDVYASLTAEQFNPDIRGIDVIVTAIERAGTATAPGPGDAG